MAAKKFNFTNNIFAKDISRDLKVAKVESYQMSLVGLVNKVIEALPESEFKTLPSWSKFNMCPDKAEGFLVRMLEAMFQSKHNLPELSHKRQTMKSKNSVEKLTTRMFFFGKVRNENMATIGNIFQDTLGSNYEVVTLYGGNVINGDRVNNRKAQQIVKDVITKAHKEGKHVIIIASNLAQRSFSIPQITELYLCYDGGQMGATVQKMSRALTPADENKVGRIFSLSFNPNRDDKFDALVLQTVMAEKKKNPSKTMEEIFEETLDTIDLFDCTSAGAVKVDADKYLTDALERNNIARAIGKLADVNKLTVGMMKALLASDAKAFTAEIQEIAETGKTKDILPKEDAEATDEAEEVADDTDERELAKDIAKVREAIVAIVENLDMILYAGEEMTVQSGLAAVLADDAMRAEFIADFNVPVEIVVGLFELGVINEAHAEVVAAAKAAE